MNRHFCRETALGIKACCVLGSTLMLVVAVPDARSLVEAQLVGIF